VDSKIHVFCITVLHGAGPPASVLVPSRLEVVMAQDHTRAPDENQSLTTESAADG
jgi:hypothetical protein